MRAEAVRICPNCGTRNKAKWEFCARCSEALAGSETVTSAAAESADEPKGASLGLRTILQVALVLALLVGGVVLLRTWAPQQVDSSLFAVPADSQPAAPAIPKPTATAGQRALEDGRRLLGEGSFAAALEQLAKAADERSQDPEVHHLYAKALYASGARDEAVAQFRLAAMLAPSQARYQADLARTLDSMGRPDEAAKAYEDLLLINPKDGDALRQLASVRTKQGKPGDAVQLLRRLDELRPGDLLVQQDLGYALEKSGDLSGAAAIYGAVVKEYPQGAGARAAGRGDLPAGPEGRGHRDLPRGPPAHTERPAPAPRTGQSPGAHRGRGCRRP